LIFVCVATCGVRGSNPSSPIVCPRLRTSHILSDPQNFPSILFCAISLKLFLSFFLRSVLTLGFFLTALAFGLLFFTWPFFAFTFQRIPFLFFLESTRGSMGFLNPVPDLLGLFFCAGCHLFFFSVPRSNLSCHLSVAGLPVVLFFSQFLRPPSSPVCFFKHVILRRFSPLPPSFRASWLSIFLQFLVFSPPRTPRRPLVNTFFFLSCPCRVAFSCPPFFLLTRFVRSLQGDPQLPHPPPFPQLFFFPVFSSTRPSFSLLASSKGFCKFPQFQCPPFFGSRDFRQRKPQLPGKSLPPNLPVTMGFMKIPIGPGPPSLWVLPPPPPPAADVPLRPSGLPVRPNTSTEAFVLDDMSRPSFAVHKIVNKIFQVFPPPHFLPPRAPIHPPPPIGAPPLTFFGLFSGCFFTPHKIFWSPIFPLKKDCPSFPGFLLA